MSTPLKFKFYIQDAAGDYLTVDGATSTKTRIVDTPMGWEQIKIQIKRDEKYFGINNIVSAPISFVGDGAKILRGLYYDNNEVNYEAYAKVTIEMFDGNDAYNVLYTGVVDFANELNDEQLELGSPFIIRLEEDNVMTDIDANADTEFTIPFDEDSINVELDGVAINSTYRWIASGIGPVNVLSGGLGSSQSYVVPMGLIKEEIDYFRNLIETQSQGSEVHTLNFPPNDANKLLYTNIQLNTIAYTLTATVTVENTSGVAGLRLRADMLKKNMAANTNDFSTMLFQNGVDIVGTVVIPITVSGTLTFDPYTFDYFLILRAPASAQGNVAIQVDDIDFRIDIVNQIPVTYTPSYRYSVATRKLLEKVTPDANLLPSFLDFSVSKQNLYLYQNSLPFYQHLTSGNALRGLEANNGLVTTFNRMWQDVSGRHALGMDISGNDVQIQPLSYFFNNTVITTIAAVSKFKKTTATEWIYNKIKAGFQDVTLDTVNAKYEVNSEQYFSTNVKKVSQELDLISEYIGSIYAIEYARGDLFGKNTTDNSRDNSVFILEVSHDIVGGNETLLRYSSPDDIGGVFSPSTHYNIGLSPHRTVIRWLGYLKSMLNNSGIDLETVKKNRALVTFINSWFIKEFDDIFIGAGAYANEPTRLFKPIIYEFECEQQENLLSLINSNKYGKIQFVDEGVTYAGYIVTADLTPAVNGAVSFSLIAAPDEDFEQLIK